MLHSTQYKDHSFIIIINTSMTARMLPPTAGVTLNSPHKNL